MLVFGVWLVILVEVRFVKEGLMEREMNRRSKERLELDDFEEEKERRGREEKRLLWDEKGRIERRGEYSPRRILQSRVR